MQKPLLKDFTIKAIIIRKPLSTWLNSQEDYYSQKKKSFLTACKNTKTTTHPRKNQAKQNQKTLHPLPTPRDLRANQVIQELGAGKEQKAPNSNRLTWESLY